MWPSHISSVLNVLLLLWPCVRETDLAHLQARVAPRTCGCFSFDTLFDYYLACSHVLRPRQSVMYIMMRFFGRILLWSININQQKVARQSPQSNSLQTQMPHILVGLISHVAWFVSWLRVLRYEGILSTVLTYTWDYWVCLGLFRGGVCRVLCESYQVVSACKTLCVLAWFVLLLY